MDESTIQSSCHIVRVGKITRLDEQAANILINGKNIKVPIAKVAEEVCLGDLVVWAGSSWKRKTSIS